MNLLMMDIEDLWLETTGWYAKQAQSLLGLEAESSQRVLTRFAYQAQRCAHSQLPVSFVNVHNPQVHGDERIALLIVQVP